MYLQFLHPTQFVLEANGTYTRVPFKTPGSTNLVGYDDHIIDFYVPVFSILKFIFYWGWLHVAQTLINPLGDDDDDFDINYIINRNVQLSYIMVEGHDEEGHSNDMIEDPFKGELPSTLPYTINSKESQQPSMPTDHLLAQIMEEDQDNATKENDGHCNEVVTEEEDSKHALQTFTREESSLSLSNRIKVKTRTISVASLKSNSKELPLSDTCK